MPTGKYTRKSPRERFESYIRVDPITGCWIWTAGISYWGYGVFWLDGKQEKAHRISYVWSGKVIPDGFDVDHTCHNSDKSCVGGRSCRHRRCVNPDHLEAVTEGENIRRGRTGEALAQKQRDKTHCPQGHKYSGVNLYVGPHGGRWCRTCARDNGARLRQRQRAI